MHRVRGVGVQVIKEHGPGNLHLLGGAGGSNNLRNVKLNIDLVLL